MTEKTKSNIRGEELQSELPAVIKICQFGMDDRAVQRISTMFKIIFKGRCELVEPDAAMVALIDADEDSAASSMQKSCEKKHPDLPIIVLLKTLTDKVQDNVRYLEKPLKREAFWNAIIEIFGGNEQEKSVAKAPIDKVAKTRPKTSNSAASLESKLNKETQKPNIARRTQSRSEQPIHFKEKNFLLYYLQNLLNEKHPANCALKIEFVYKYQIILYPDKKMALSNLSDSQFRTVATMPLTDNKMYKLIIEKKADMDEKLSSGKGDFSPMTIDALLWTLALRTSRGRLPKGTPVDKDMYLHAWPNFPQLCNTPHAMRIAALWINNPSSLNELAVLLDIAFEDVYSFYTAAHALGLAGRSKRKSKTIIETQPVTKNKKRGLFGAILRRLNSK